MYSRDVVYTCILFLFGGLAIDLNKIRSNTIVYMYVHVAYMNSLFYFRYAYTKPVIIQHATDNKVGIYTSICSMIVWMIGLVLPYSY